jgi:hypothetical protein
MIITYTAVKYEKPSRSSWMCRPLKALPVDGGVDERV